MPKRDGRSSVIVEDLLDRDAFRTELLAELRAGLVATPKRLSPVWFYDDAGSRLFDEITRLPEYYLTRAERSILTNYAADIAKRTGAETLVELGSGTSDKTRLLIDALRDAGTLRRFVPLDVSEPILREAATTIADEYPGLEVQAIVGDFHKHLGAISDDGVRLVAFLGSTIGNFGPDERQRFFVELANTLWSTDWLLLGTDLVKDPLVLEAAYNDRRGVTAQFNKNVLRVLNRELAANFDVDAFDHHAIWNAKERWIEMRLQSRVAQRVAIPGIDLDIGFAAGEDLLTEISAKFEPEQVRDELWTIGFVSEETFTDPDGQFMLTLARPYY